MAYEECSDPTCGNPVFATGLCRKHYDRERLATAAPCTVSDCNGKAYRGGLCQKHYRAKLNASKPRCTVPGCENHQKTLKSGLCEKHLFRATRHGKVEQPRPADWGAREQHPLYKSWAWHKRGGASSMVDEWRNDFWAFVAAVGDRPEGHQLRRFNTSKPIGPGNWEWAETIPSKDKARYQRDWRNRNPRKAKSNDLKKHYGITLEQYEKMFEEQEGKCAICGGYETALDRDGGLRRLSVDHNHETGKVRALLCTNCNRAIGVFKEDTSILLSAIEYLEKHDRSDV